jgi:hypothetical protein
MINQEKNRKSQERRRRKSGAKPREQYEADSVSSKEPWKLEGISRATWYRRRKAGETSPSRPLLIILRENDEPVSPCQPQGTSITSTPSEPSLREPPPREIIIVPPICPATTAPLWFSALGAIGLDADETVKRWPSGRPMGSRRSMLCMIAAAKSGFKYGASAYVVAAEAVAS